MFNQESRILIYESRVLWEQIQEKERKQLNVLWGFYGIYDNISHPLRITCS